jgi:hypothetical protein
MLSSADIKRQIIDEAKNSSIRKKVEILPSGVTEGDQIEIGSALDITTKTAGWAMVESYMLQRMNLVNMVITDNSSDIARGTAKGFIEMMQWIHLAIKQKNDILEKERLKHEESSQTTDGSGQAPQTEDVPV